MNSQQIGEPDLAGGYDEVTPHRGPSPATVEADPSGGGPGTELDLTGYSVEASDGHIGEVTGLDQRLLVVDIGRWIFGRTVLVPIDIVEQLDHRERTIRLSRTRQQIRNAPDQDAAAVAAYYARS